MHTQLCLTPLLLTPDPLCMCRLSAYHSWRRSAHSCWCSCRQAFKHTFSRGSRTLSRKKVRGWQPVCGVAQLLLSWVFRCTICTLIMCSCIATLTYGPRGVPCRPGLMAVLTHAPYHSAYRVCCQQNAFCHKTDAVHGVAQTSMHASKQVQGCCYNDRQGGGESVQRELSALALLQVLISGFFLSSS